MKNIFLLAMIGLLVLSACTGGRVDKDARVGIDTETHAGIDSSRNEEKNTTPEAPPEIPAVADTSVTLSQGSFASKAHKGAGTARIVSRGDLLTLELDGFSVDRGPDLHVYMATDDSASEFLDLGLLQKFNGYQIYTIPNNANIAQYDRVLIWCQAFGVLFSSAEMS